MKKALGFLLALCLVLTTSTAFAEIKFDLTPFENDETFTVEFDEMDDTGEISNSTGAVAIMDNDDGGLIGVFNIRIIEDYPPVIRMQFIYHGDDLISADRFIIKTDAHRYTFEIETDSEVQNGSIFEAFTVVLTDKTVSLIPDILNNGDSDIRFRLSGDRSVDGNLLISTKENLEKLYNAYVASGALDNNFTVLNTFYKCEIK